MGIRIAVAIAVAVITIYIVSGIAIPAIHALQKYEELIVVYPPGYDLGGLESLGCSVERVFRKLDMALVSCPATASSMIRGLGIYAVPNFNVSLDTTVNRFRVYGSIRQVGAGELGIPVAWSWAASRVGADIVWRYLGVTGYGATIAILDTGIDPSHPLLAGKLKGWIEFDRKGRAVCSSPRDTYGHGTWVASIAVGGDTSNYIFGVAPYADIVVALVLPGGYGTAAQVLAGLEWSLEPYDCRGGRLGLKPDAVSMSFGAAANYSNVFLQAIAKLIEGGIVPVAAIGNSGPHTTSNPGNIWGVVGVGATDFDNGVAWFSSYEDIEWPEPPPTWPFKGRYPREYRKPDIVSPGVDVVGAYPGELLAIGSGTSASTPIVAGIAAMVSRVLQSKGFSGSRLVEEVYNILISTASPIDSPGSGSGLVNAFRAVSKALERRVYMVEVEVNPSTATLWEEVNVSVRGVVEGVEISVYMAGVEIYRGLYRSGTAIRVRVPPTHIGGNEVVVIDRGGMYYGEALVSVYPSIYISPRNTSIGQFITAAISGLGVGDLIAIYIEGNILTLDMANLRGSYLKQLAIPYLPQGKYNLVLVDFSTPSIRLTTTIDVAGEAARNVTHVINRTEVYNYTYVSREYIALPITVNTKQYYIFNTVDYIDVASAHPDMAIKNITFRSIHSRRISYSVVNITEISGGVYRVWFTAEALEPIDEDDTIVYIAVDVVNSSIVYPTMIRLLATDPINQIRVGVRGLTAELGNLNSTVLDIDRRVLNLSKSVAGLVEGLGKAVDRIGELDVGLRAIRRNITGYEPTLNYISRRLVDVEGDVEHVERVLYIAITAAAISVALAAASIVYVHRGGR